MAANVHERQTQERRKLEKGPGPACLGPRGTSRRCFDTMRREERLAPRIRHVEQALAPFRAGPVPVPAVGCDAAPARCTGPEAQFGRCATTWWLNSRARGPRGDGHCGNASDDAYQPDPRRRGQVFSEEQDADRHADRHPQIGLRRGADRAERLHQAEIDHEGGAVENTESASKARIDSGNGAWVHGCSVTRLTGMSTAANSAPRAFIRS